MMSPNDTRVQKLWAWAFIIVSVLSILYIGSAVYTKQTTGLLVVSVNRGAVVSLLGDKSRPIFFNSNHVKALVKPGHYIVIGTIDKTQSRTDVTVNAKQTSRVSLVVSPPVPDQSIVQGNKLVKLLPFTGPNFDYSIDYSYDLSGPIAQPIIIISPQVTNGEQEALDWIKKQGYDPKILKIQVSSATNNQAGQ